MADLITRTAKRLYEERYMTSAQGRPIQDLLFSNMDEDLSASFELGRYVSSPYGMSYRDPVNQSIIRKFNPGTTELIEVPRGSEKTPIDEQLRDAVAVGMEPTEGQLMQMARNVDQILGDHTEGWNMTKAKQALDVVRTGVFGAKGANGADLGLDYDHTRSVSNALTYDFTAGGATMNEALVNVSNRLDATGTPKGNRYAIMGSTWLSQFGADSGIIELMKANSNNMIIAQQMFDERFGQVNGLYVVAQFRPVGALAPMWILSYEPGTSYVAYKGASAAPFIPATELLAGSLDDRTWNIKRGVDALTDMGTYQRAVGDLVVDSFVENDPVTTFVRSQSRHIYIYGNIDHTLKSTGTFA
jgi:hypothetical protein